MDTKSLPQIEWLIQEAIELGVTDAKQISTQDVFTGEWVLLKCQYGCGGYNRRLTCPPYSPTPDQTRRMLDEYETAVLLHSSATEWAKQGELRDIAIKLERKAFLAGYHKAFAMGAGPCHLCNPCGFEEGCKHANAARPAMEACGIDVFQTVRAAGMPIKVVTDRECPQDYYALLMVD